MKTIRFNDIKVGESFMMHIGPTPCLCEKTSDTHLSTLDRHGAPMSVRIGLVNEDDVKPVGTAAIRLLCKD